MCVLYCFQYWKVYPYNIVLLKIYPIFSCLKSVQWYTITNYQLLFSQEGTAKYATGTVEKKKNRTSGVSKALLVG